MPRLSAVALRAALVYLLLGFSFGALMLANKGVPFSGAVWILLAPHVEFLFIGWTVQLIFGVAFWILPRYPGGSRGSIRLAWLSLLSLNLGILVAALAAFIPGPLLFAGRLLESAGAALFALHAWGRVRPGGKR
jgi:hypothetical protein